ncbi:hypothetical protein [Natrialba swarupiae]|uniref:Uncharacterized protein n=1 Tax=Natrialba swarupiae TaxID=2448032 RepID=A0A5D5AQR5_9EURY|nr:hypothetical protein [Natrialba swarupiae]MCW8173091.1 hypothetical protein [Natrialba swarupiae]TYT63353.1 hypothetical protein FYC77_04590 [Natrialba swarupiae]
MVVGTVSSRTIGISSALGIGFVTLASLGIYYIYTQAWGLVFELAYVIVLLIVFAIVADRLLIR